MDLWDQPMDRPRRDEPVIVPYDPDIVCAQQQTFAYIQQLLERSPASVVIVRGPRQRGITHVALSLCAGWWHSDVEFCVGTRNQLAKASMHYARLHERLPGERRLSLPSRTSPVEIERDNFWYRRVTMHKVSRPIAVRGVDTHDLPPVSNTGLVVYDNATPAIDDVV